MWKVRRCSGALLLLMACYGGEPGKSSPADLAPDEPSFESVQARLAAAVACEDLGAIIDSAAALRTRGHHRKAEAIYSKILAEERFTSCVFWHARCRNGLAAVSFVEGRLLKALEWYNHAHATLATVRADSSEAEDKIKNLQSTLEVNRGQVYFRLGWLEEARDSVDRLLATSEERAENVDSATQILSAQLYRLEGKTREAKAMLQDIIDSGSDVKANIRPTLWMELARINAEEGDFDQAEASLDKAYETARPLGKMAMANVLADRAELELRRRNWKECVRRVDEALDLAQVAGIPDLNFQSHARFLKSKALWHLGEPELAKRTADQGLALLEATRDAWRDLGLQFFSLRQHYYRHRIDLSIATEEPENLWGVFESYRARGLLESSVARARRGGANPSAESLERIESLHRDLLEVLHRLDQLGPETRESVVTSHKKRLRALRTALREVRAEQLLAAGRSEALPEAGVAKVRAMIDSETLALIVAGGVETVHLLALNHDGEPERHTLSLSREELGSLVAQIVRALDPRTPANLQSHLESLVLEMSHALLDPITDRLDLTRRLVIAIDAPLETLPFEILVHPQSARSLVVTHEIAYVPSFSFLYKTRNRVNACPPVQTALLPLGDPIFSSRDPRWPESLEDPRDPNEALALPRLPGSAREIRQITRYYPPPVRPALAENANRDRILAGAAASGVLHLASHARSDQEVPERSKIALSCLDSEGRVVNTCDLYFKDVATLELCGQIVVLSACETAGGPLVAGEGALGLPWAFLSAGASSVVASLWRVEDDATAELMRVFHRHLSAGQGPASALHRAKLELIDRGRPPSHWAPFVVLGDWRVDESLSTILPEPGPTDQTN